MTVCAAHVRFRRRSGHETALPLFATGLGVVGVVELFACKCALAATIHENSCRNCFASTERPQIIVGMLAPTSGAIGDGKEIGAAPSWGRERPRCYNYSQVLRHQHFATPERGIRSRRVDPWSNFSCVVKRDKELLARNVLWRCGPFQE